MKLQVLISTMHQTDYSLLDKMNIQSDAIVVNQCDKNEIVEFEYNNHSIKWISSTERGVGKSRNLAMTHSTADILLFADDDIVYSDGYVQGIIHEFSLNKRAGLIVFNFVSLNEKRPEYIDQKNHRLHWYNCLKYGAFRIAVKKEQFLKKNIFFSLLFGGGALFQAGEDNLFITNAIHHNIKCFASDKTLGTVAQKESTWFKGYDEKYYKDKGCLFAAMYGWRAPILLFLLEVKNSKSKSDYKLSRRLKLEITGVNEFRKNW